MLSSHLVVVALDGEILFITTLIDIQYGSPLTDISCELMLYISIVYILSSTFRRDGCITFIYSTIITTKWCECQAMNQL